METQVFRPSTSVNLCSGKETSASSRLFSRQEGGAKKSPNQHPAAMFSKMNNPPPPPPPPQKKNSVLKCIRCGACSDGLVSSPSPLQICPICASLPGGDPNHVTDDFAAHLTLEHRAPRDLDESSGVRHVRRMFHPGRGLGGPRARRSNMHFTSSTSGGSSTTQTSTQSSNYNREAMDPIAELLSQLSGVRRSAGGQLSSGPSASQLQQLQMQLQLERQQTQAARQQLETARSATQRSSRTSTNAGLNANPSPGHHNANPSSNSTSPNPGHHEFTTHTQHSNSQFLLNRLSEPRLSEAERQLSEGQWADRSLFVTELLLSTLLADPDHSEDDDLHDYHDAVIRGSDAFSDFGTFGDMGCVEVMTLDVALENLNLREQKEQRPPPL
uniref:RING-type E3 ubiquitin transferase n=1 Tax=Oncorhynchus mykiss TaxID=8022 RepID=A0A8L0DKQ8_ONCMY